ncbi:hypothetical protein CAPTEDRAFT_187826, partial [Capitella teleta]
MGESWKQFKLLLWKNWLLQKRKKLLTAFEIGVPVLFAVVIMLVRQLVDATQYNDITTWPQLPIGDDLPAGLRPLPGIDSWSLAFVPDTNLTQGIMRNAANRLGMGTKGFDTEIDMENFIASRNTSDNDIMMAIVFQNVIDSLPKDIRYKIRPRAEQLNGEEDANTVRFFSASDWRTTSLVPFWPENGPREPLEDD